MPSAALSSHEPANVSSELGEPACKTKKELLSLRLQKCFCAGRGVWAQSPGPFAGGTAEPPASSARSVLGNPGQCLRSH